MYSTYIGPFLEEYPPPPPPLDMGNDYRSGPYFQYVAPVANMGQLQVESVPAFSHLHEYRPFLPSSSSHDYYSDRFALEPEEQPVLYAGDHYSDRYALADSDNDDLPPLQPMSARQLGQIRRRERERKGRDEGLDGEKHRQELVKLPAKAPKAPQNGSVKAIDSLARAFSRNNPEEERSFHESGGDIKVETGEGQEMEAIDKFKDENSSVRGGGHARRATTKREADDNEQEYEQPVHSFKRTKYGRAVRVVNYAENS